MTTLQPAASPNPISVAGRLLAITGVGPDKPGLVAGLTQLVCEFNGNIDDSTMTRLAGQFAMILIVTLPADTDDEAFLTACNALAQQLNIALNVSPLAEPAPKALAAQAPHAEFILTVAGHDRTGITYHVTQTLAKHGANITDLTARQMQGDDGLVYLMVVEFDLTDAAARQALQAELDTLASTLNLDMRCRPIDTVAL
jgi:glycine cleavage system transcriptional repressor